MPWMATRIDLNGSKHTTPRSTGLIRAAITNIHLWHVAITLIFWSYMVHPHYHGAITELLSNATPGLNQESQQPHKYAYPTTIWLVMSILLYIDLSVLPNWILSGLSNEENAHLSIQTAFLLVDSVFIGLSSQFDSQFQYDPSRYKEVIITTMVYWFCGHGVNTIMNRCHTTSIHWGRDEQVQVQAKEWRVLLYTGLVLLCFVTAGACLSLTWIVQYHKRFCLQYLLRFICMLCDLGFCLKWCLVSREKLNASRLPGYDTRFKRWYQRRLAFIKHSWLMLLQICYLIALITSRYEITFFYCSFRLSRGTRMVKTCDLGSMLGYYTPRELTLECVGEEDFHENNRDCIVCLEEFVHTTHRSVPEYDNAVKLQCRHIFHVECLTKWMDQREECPTCKKPVFVERDRTDNTFTEVSLRTLKKTKWTGRGKGILKRYYNKDSDTSGESDFDGDI